MTRKLRIPGRTRSDASVLNSLTPPEAGWEQLHFDARRLRHGQEWKTSTGGCEMVVVLLGGVASFETSRGNWSRVGRRESVFDGMPYALYLPRQTELRLVADSEFVEFAACWTPVSSNREPRLVTPAAVDIEIRGGGNATRQINGIVPPGFGSEKLVCVEVYTPSGNWSSYPPHKHDRHVVADSGEVLEADLEEIYFYKFRKPNGFAFQRIYNDDRSLDESVVAQDNDVVLVPEGYHPVATAYGYDCYYLNFLAGSAQSLAATFDPAHDWTRDTWTEKDPRVPLVTHKMEQKVTV